VSEESRTITVSRTNLVEGAIRKLIGPANENRDSRMFVLRPEKIIEPVQYKRNYADRAVGWDDASTSVVRELDTSSPDAAKVVARSVHIFIIPCAAAATDTVPR
ncbi:MAG: hypothetical protein ACPG4T_22700, partial [Nannocystaceae bacterium]